jgi:hypothetical protein
MHRRKLQNDKCVSHNELLLSLSQYLIVISAHHRVCLSLHICIFISVVRATLNPCKEDNRGKTCSLSISELDGMHACFLRVTLQDPTACGAALARRDLSTHRLKEVPQIA